MISMDIIIGEELLAFKGFLRKQYANFMTYWIEIGNKNKKKVNWICFKNLDFIMIELSGAYSGKFQEKRDQMKMGYITLG